MHPITRSERGAAPILELFVLAAVMGVVGFTAHLYMDHKMAVNPTVKPIPHVPDDATPTPSVSPTHNWTAFTAQFGGYSLKYDPKLKTKYCTDGASYDDLQLELSEDRLLPCNTGNGNWHIQTQIYSQSGDALYSYDVAEGGYDGKVTDATIGGVAGHRYEGTKTEHTEIDYPPIGTKYIKYVFLANSKTYEFLYHQQPGDTDLSSDFDRMVKTVKF